MISLTMDTITYHGILNTRQTYLSLRFVLQLCFTRVLHNPELFHIRKRLIPKNCFKESGVKWDSRKSQNLLSAEYTRLKLNYGCQIRL